MVMEKWRREKSEIHQDHRHNKYHNQGGIVRAQQSRTGRHSIGWHQTVPSWEKEFCTSVGLVPWCKLLETKKLMYQYENVVKWNDSAGEEAFWNAKKRFWAKINKLPCDIKPPDPDIYIDEIDWNAYIEPELLSDLENGSVQPDETLHKEGTVIIGNPAAANGAFFCTGWGDAEDDPQVKSPEKPANGVLAPRVNEAENERGWENQRDDWYDYKYGSGKTRGSGTWKASSRKWDRQDNRDQGWNPSRYKISRFRNEKYQPPDRWPRKGWKRVGFDERPWADRKPVYDNRW